jgi:hypothetical protein
MARSSLRYVLPLAFMLLAMPSAEAGSDWQRTVGDWETSSRTMGDGETLTAASLWSTLNKSELTFFCHSGKGGCAWFLAGPNRVHTRSDL